jgi:hypothetical protein
VLAIEVRRLNDVEVDEYERSYPRPDEHDRRVAPKSAAADDRDARLGQPFTHGCVVCRGDR